MFTRITQKVMAPLKKLSIAQKASLAILLTQFLQKGLAMISTPIFTRFMTEYEYGVVTNYNSWQSILSIIATLNLSQGVFNTGMLEFENDRDSFEASLLALSNVCTIICVGIFSIVYRWIGQYIGLPFSLLGIMLLYILFYPAYSFWSLRQRYEFKYKTLTIITIVVASTQVALQLWAVIGLQNGNRAVAKIVATEAVLIVAGLIMYGYILVKAKLKIRLSYIWYGLRFNIFLVPHFLAMSVLTSGDRIMISSMVGEEKTAIYGISYTVASAILIFWQAIEASWTPWLFENLKRGNTQRIKKRAVQIITAFAGVAILCMLFAPEIMRILAPAEYMEGVNIIPSVTASAYFMAVYALYMRIEYYSKKTTVTMLGTLGAAALNVFLNYVCIPRYGYMVAGFTTMICYIFLYIVHNFYVHRIGMAYVYHNRYIALLSACMAMLSIGVTAIYPYMIFRYALIVVSLLLIWVFRRNLLSLLRQLMNY